MTLLEQLTKLSEISAGGDAVAVFVPNGVKLTVSAGVFTMSQVYWLSELAEAKHDVFEGVVEAMRDELYENHHDLERAKRG